MLKGASVEGEDEQEGTMLTLEGQYGSQGEQMNIL